ncbi:MAG TPA: nuclear transport factor 2 family protein [Segetibacter sp.]|jgi:ketosteroid isomerase-like protein
MTKQLFCTGIIAAGLLICNVSFAQSKEQKEVAAAVEALRKAMIDPDSTTLANLTFAELSYGHSGGKVEDRATFLQTLVTGKSDFVSIDLADQTIKIVGNTAIVHHMLSAQTNDGGKPGTVKIAVMYTWQKQKGDWKMLVRQAVKTI